MCDCFPQYGGSIPVPPECVAKTGSSEYAFNYKQWCNPVNSGSFAPERNQLDNPENQRYSFSKGPRFGIPPYCDCTPPPERFRFETTYQHDFVEGLHKDYSKNMRHPVLPGVTAQQDIFLPPQHLCPFTTETTYARAFDMPQTHFKHICSQQDPCGGCGQPSCEEIPCEPSGLEIRFDRRKQRPYLPRLKVECLIPPGTDLSSCCACKRVIPPCPAPGKICCEDPCLLHMAATTPTRIYPPNPNGPKYIPDPRIPVPQPLFLCGGGTLECPVKREFPTETALLLAREAIKDKLETERCRFPPEAQESTYRASYRTPPLTDVPKYCSAEQQCEARKVEEEVAAKGLPAPCLPAYCLDGGRPPDPRPMFDHMSTYEADYIWEYPQRFKLLGGEIPCKVMPQPLCDPCGYQIPAPLPDCMIERTEEKERWGEDWECNPEP